MVHGVLFIWAWVCAQCTYMYHSYVALTWSHIMYMYHMYYDM